MTPVAEMTALVWTAPLEAELQTVPVPVPAEDEVVVAVRAVGVCGSDLHGYRGLSPLRTAPLVLGHEVVGEGPNGGLFVVNPLTACGACALCAAGRPNLCPDRGLLGLDRPGAFAERVSVARENLHPLPPGMTPVAGTLVEPLATGIGALRGVPIDAGTVVAVIGAGPIGLLVAHAVRQRGPGLLVHHDLDAGRVAHAAQVADVADVSLAAVAAAVAQVGDGLGADVVIDAVGVAETWNAAIDLVRPGGLVVEVGLAQGVGPLSVGDLVRRGITVRGAYAYTPEDFADALALLTHAPSAEGWVRIAALDAGPAVLADLAAGRGGIKTVLVP